MRKLTVAICLVASLLAQPSRISVLAKAQIEADAKRNEQYRKLLSNVNVFVAKWDVDCHAEGKILKTQATGALACVVPTPPVNPENPTAK